MSSLFSPSAAEIDTTTFTDEELADALVRSDDIGMMLAKVQYDHYKRVVGAVSQSRWSSSRSPSIQTPLDQQPGSHFKRTAPLLAPPPENPAVAQDVGRSHQGPPPAARATHKPGAGSLISPPISSGQQRESFPRVPSVVRDGTSPHASVLAQEQGMVASARAAAISQQNHHQSPPRPWGQRSPAKVGSKHPPDNQKAASPAEQNSRATLADVSHVMSLSAHNVSIHRQLQRQYTSLVDQSMSVSNKNAPVIPSRYAAQDPGVIRTPYKYGVSAAGAKAKNVQSVAVDAPPHPTEEDDGDFSSESDLEAVESSSFFASTAGGVRGGISRGPSNSLAFAETGDFGSDAGDDGNSFHMDSRQLQLELERRQLGQVEGPRSMAVSTTSPVQQSAQLNRDNTVQNRESVNPMPVLDSSATPSRGDTVAIEGDYYEPSAIKGPPPPPLPTPRVQGAPSDSVEGPPQLNPTKGAQGGVPGQSQGSVPAGTSAAAPAASSSAARSASAVDNARPAPSANRSASVKSKEDEGLKHRSKSKRQSEMHKTDSSKKPAEQPHAATGPPLSSTPAAETSRAKQAGKKGGVESESTSQKEKVLKKGETAPPSPKSSVNRKGADAQVKGPGVTGSSHRRRGRSTSSSSSSVSSTYSYSSSYSSDDVSDFDDVEGDPFDASPIRRAAAPSSGKAPQRGIATAHPTAATGTQRRPLRDARALSPQAAIERRAATAAGRRHQFHPEDVSPIRRQSADSSRATIRSGPQRAGPQLQQSRNAAVNRPQSHPLPLAGSFVGGPPRQQSVSFRQPGIIHHQNLHQHQHHQHHHHHTLLHHHSHGQSHHRDHQQPVGLQRSLTQPNITRRRTSVQHGGVDPRIPIQPPPSRPQFSHVPTIPLPVSRPPQPKQHPALNIPEAQAEGTELPARSEGDGSTQVPLVWQSSSSGCVGNITRLQGRQPLQRVSLPVPQGAHAEGVPPSGSVAGNTSENDSGAKSSGIKRFQLPAPQPETPSPPSQASVPLVKPHEVDRIIHRQYDPVPGNEEPAGQWIRPSYM